MNNPSPASDGRYDVAILGAGFSGCLLAWILAKSGRRVVLIDRATHPRFAIGESSTPLADFLLERIAEEFDISELKPLSRWGSWQSTYPSLRCGKKRGFSYFHHEKSQFVEPSRFFDQSLLVAASENDHLSDTHWMRSDVDAWFYQHAMSCGVTSRMEYAVRDLARSHEDYWRLSIEQQGATGGGHELVKAALLVDATGPSGVLGGLLNIESRTRDLQVRKSAVFGHFEQVGRMSNWLCENGVGIEQDCFDADDAAQHHLIDEGWIWMLRFSEGTTSVGIVTDSFQQSREPEELWESTIAPYPALRDLLVNARLVAPIAKSGHRSAPKLASSARISRLWGQASGSGWWMLPGTVGIVDPLHSTGIAHALSGVQRVARKVLSEGKDPTAPASTYSSDVVSEVLWIDQFVQAAYLAKEVDIKLFYAACSLYFVSAIQCERQMAATGEMVDGFLGHRAAGLRELAEWFTTRLTQLCDHSSPQEIARLYDEFRSRLAPWNDVGLLETNRVVRSAAPK